MRRYLTIGIILMLAVMTVGAQGHRYCDRDYGRARTRGIVESSVSSLVGEKHIPVLFIAYQDVGFSTPGIMQKWDAMLNEKGYSEHEAAGSVSDYFDKQSGGRFKLHFDVMGPVTLSKEMAYYGRNINGDDVNPQEMIQEACLLTGKDFAPYDWDGDSIVDVVLAVYAGYGENRGGKKDAIWPHKWNIRGMKVGDLELRSYACVSELDGRGVMDGYGTFIHEFSHCLGLPDLYPSDADVFSYFDEWDLMDGGNYANNGWSPPNYSAFERQLCDWQKPVYLTSATSVAGMPCLDEEPIAYLIRSDDNYKQYYLLENRQQRGFDRYVPGNGLLITYVDGYNGSLFPNSGREQVKLVYADNRTYRQSEAFFGNNDKYTPDGHNNILSLAAYPYVADGDVNDRLTDGSVPAMAFHKPVTNILMSDDGRISFDFMKEATAISSVTDDKAPDTWYDLQGRRLQSRPTHKGLYIHNGKKELVL